MGQRSMRPGRVLALGLCVASACGLADTAFVQPCALYGLAPAEHGSRPSGSLTLRGWDRGAFVPGAGPGSGPRQGSRGSAAGRFVGRRRAADERAHAQRGWPCALMVSPNGRAEHSGLGQEQLVGGSLGMSAGFAYGSKFGPSSDRTWTMEAAMVASLRQILVEAGVGGTEGEESRGRPTAEGLLAGGMGEGAEAGRQAGSVQRAEPASRDSRTEKLCALLAENLFKLVTVGLEAEGRAWSVEGLITEVQNEGGAVAGGGSAFVTLLQSDGTFAYLNVRDVAQVNVCTMGGSSEVAARAHLSTHRKQPSAGMMLPSHLLNDVNLSVLRAMSASFGRQVLVQNLRHVILGFSGCRVLWSEFLSDGLGGGEGDAMQRMLGGEGSWMVKVMSEHESKSASAVKSTRWVPVSWVLPMSDYDLHVYSAYRHSTLPSSEYDLQRHDEHLLKRYKGQSMPAGEGLVGGALVGGGADGDTLVGGSGGHGSRLFQKYTAPCQYSYEDLALVG